MPYSVMGGAVGASGGGCCCWFNWFGGMELSALTCACGGMAGGMVGVKPRPGRGVEPSSMAGAGGKPGGGARMNGG